LEAEKQPKFHDISSILLQITVNLASRLHGSPRRGRSVAAGLCFTQERQPLALRRAFVHCRSLLKRGGLKKMKENRRVSSRAEKRPHGWIPSTFLHKELWKRDGALATKAILSNQVSGMKKRVKRKSRARRASIFSERGPGIPKRREGLKKPPTESN